MTSENSESVGGERSNRSAHGKVSPSVLVAIVNYCTADLSIDCLRSLENEVASHQRMQVVVADNASPDGSGALIALAIEEQGWSAWASLLPLNRNGGFAYGNNAIIRKVLRETGQPDFIWLLNSDTVVRPGALEALLSFMDRNPSAGIIGSCLEDPDGTQQTSAFRFHSILGELEASLAIGPISRLLHGSIVSLRPERRTMPADWLSGASMLVRASVIEQIGLMDETYFLYYEETDFCRRARLKGWECWLVADSRVIHLIGRSTKVTGSPNLTRRRSAYWFQSRRFYFEKNHGRTYAIAADAMLAVGTIINRILSAAGLRENWLPEFFLRDLLRHSAIWPKRATAAAER